MTQAYTDYLALLSQLSEHLGQLAETAREKTAAVRGDDLMALDRILNREQALALALRGLEQKRLKLLAGMGLGDIPLRELAAKYPPELRLQARRAAEELQRRYQVYQSAAEVARSTLEVNLHEIEKLLGEAGAGQAPGAGYSHPDAELPANMKTDIRA